MKKVNLSKTKEKQFVDLFNQAKSNYLDTMKAFHNKDVNLGLQVAERKRKLMLDYEKFYLENHTVQWTAYLIDRLKRMTGSIHKLGRLVYE